MRTKSVGYDARSPPRIIRASNLLGYNYVQISPVFPRSIFDLRFRLDSSQGEGGVDGRVRPLGEIALHTRQIVDARSPRTVHTSATTGYWPSTDRSITDHPLRFIKKRAFARTRALLLHTSSLPPPLSREMIELRTRACPRGSHVYRAIFPSNELDTIFFRCFESVFRLVIYSRSWSEVEGFRSRRRGFVSNFLSK